jgi:mannose-6-phosphate isomerase-like protein (cupin superfamily)
MVKVSEFFGKYPCKPGEKKPTVITKDKMITYIYTPENPHMSDLNWMYASTNRIFSGSYQLAPGSSFDPTDVHAGDEIYYILKGTVTMFNPELGQVVEVKKGESILLPKDAPHKGYNFGCEEAHILYVIAPRVWEEGENGPPVYDDSRMKVLKYKK